MEEEERNIQMVDLHRQYLRFKPEIDRAMQTVVDECAFINGGQVRRFASHLSERLGGAYVVPCGNGTDALQIAMMALGLSPGDEVLVPAFNYVAAAEAAALLGLVPVWVDVGEDTFNLDAEKIEQALSVKTRAIVAVHLFGQACDMEHICEIAEKNKLYVIEDNAQSLGAEVRFSDGTKRMAGMVGHVGTLSFFPSKPLACFGDGGAAVTSDASLAGRMRMIATHGQNPKYHHRMVGCNSRLDTLQAAVLDAKLPHFDEFTQARQAVAVQYDKALSDDARWAVPQRVSYSTHVFHQYTIRVADGKRDALQEHLRRHGIPSMVYYPLPLHRQDAFQGLARVGSPLPNAEMLPKSVLSLPIHTEMTEEEIGYISRTIRDFG